MPAPRPSKRGYANRNGQPTPSGLTVTERLRITPEFAQKQKTAPQAPPGGTTRVRFCCLTAQLGRRWAPRSWPPTEQARPHKHSPRRRQRSLPSTPTPRLSTSAPAKSAPGTRSRGRPPNRLESSLRRPRHPFIRPDRHGLVRLTKLTHRTLLTETYLIDESAVSSNCAGRR